MNQSAPLVLALSVLVLGALGCETTTSSPPDGGPDAAPPPPDASAACRGGMTCDDGLYCNGAETCEPLAAGADSRGCVAGAPPCAGDQSCNEALDACFSSCGASMDADGDGARSYSCGGLDCDDQDPTRFPSALEVCDLEGRDEDCDPSTFGVYDADRDGVIDARCCNPAAPGEQRACGEDCDDTRADVSPGGTEVCNGRDDDCDGVIDEMVSVDGFEDRDRDGRGNPASPLRGCAERNGLSMYDDDCNDGNLTIHGAATEICDSLDNDCDGRVDEATSPVSWYPDLDGDGFGDPREAPEVSCAPLPARSILATDCDDETSDRSPAAPEACNGIDDDCANGADFGVAPGNSEDDDRDGAADPECMMAASDCDDRSARARAGATELCNGRDDDCDGERDELCVQCAEDGDCGVGLRCVAGRCGMSCGAGGACPSGLTCCADACVDLQADRANCGGCGIACDLPQATASCVAGACAVASCTPPFADCNGEPGDGCEADLSSSRAHCGQCARACSLDAATSSCRSGACTLGECLPGRGDCNGVIADGCEAVLSDDDANCGACGNPCPTVANGTTDCMAGSCLLVCAPGWGNCDGALGNGCELGGAAEVVAAERPGQTCRQVTGPTVSCIGGRLDDDGNVCSGFAAGNPYICGLSTSFGAPTRVDGVVLFTASQAVTANVLTNDGTTDVQRASLGLIGGRQRRHVPFPAPLTVRSAGVQFAGLNPAGGVDFGELYVYACDP